MEKQNNLPAWDLNDLYQGIEDKQIEEDLNTYRDMNQTLATEYKGKVAKLTPRKFFEAVQLYENAAGIASKLGIYAYLNMVTQMKNKEAVAFYQNINEKLTEFGKMSIFFTLEINALSEKDFNELLQNEQVAHYKPWLSKIRLFKPYELDEDMEALLADKALTSSAAWMRLYDETASKLKYTVDGKEYNDAEIGKLMQDKDPLLREKAGKELNRVNKENGELFTFIYNMIVKDKAISDEKRGFKSPVASRNLDNMVEDDVVEALSQAVQAQYKNISERFYKLKAKWLGKDKIQYWDRNAPLPFAKDENVSWDQAVQTVLRAYGSFSKDFAAIGQQFFEHPWIDVPPRSGKQSGAFCAGTGGMPHPYLLLNFNGKERDILTLAHELGHGCHHILCYPQGDLNDQTPKVLAEVASVFAEMVTFQNLLKDLDDNEAKLSLIAGKVSDMINTVSRQIAFHFYESRMHEERKKGEVPVERIREIWVEEMRNYLGPYVNVDDDSSYLWAHLSHVFEQPFYVYAYAFADCLVNSLYQVYRDGSVKNFAEKYMHMLSETGIKRYDELLKPFGLDAHDPKFWDKGMDLIAEYISELERLNRKLGL